MPCGGIAANYRRNGPKNQAEHHVEACKQLPRKDRINVRTLGHFLVTQKKSLIQHHYCKQTGKGYHPISSLSPLQHYKEI